MLTFAGGGKLSSKYQGMLGLLLILFCAPVQSLESSMCRKTNVNLYQFSRKTLPEFGAETIEFNAYKGDVVLVVNVASF